MIKKESSSDRGKRLAIAAANSMRAFADRWRAAEAAEAAKPKKTPLWLEAILIEEKHRLSVRAAAPPPAAEKSIADQDIESFVRDIVRTHGGNIAQAKGAEIVRVKFPKAVREGDPKFHKKYLMGLFAAANGTRKRGPKGPRKNRQIIK